MTIKTPPSSSPFPPVATEHVLLEFQATAREYRIRVLALFLAVAVAFGVISWRFFHAPVWEALLVTGGLALFMLQALPRSRYLYRFTLQGVDSAEITGDTYGLHRLIPLIGGIAILLVLVLSLPAISLAYIGFSCAVVLFFAPRLFPAKSKPVLLFLGWTTIDKVVAERDRQAFLLSPVAGVNNDCIVVFTPKSVLDEATGKWYTETNKLIFTPESILDTALTLVRKHAGQAIFEDGIVIR